MALAESVSEISYQDSSQSYVRQINVFPAEFRFIRQSKKSAPVIVRSCVLDIQKAEGAPNMTSYGNAIDNCVNMSGYTTSFNDQFMWRST